MIRLTVTDKIGQYKTNMSITASSILMTGKSEKPFDMPKAMQWARENHGRSSFRQLSDILRLSLGRQHFEPKFYFFFWLLPCQ